MRTGKILKNIRKFGFFLYGRWEDLDRCKWLVIDVGVILDTSASHSEIFFFDIFRDSYNRHPTPPYTPIPHPPPIPQDRENHTHTHNTPE